MRTLIEAGMRCAEHKRFAFAVMNGTKICCAADSVERMCGECRDAAKARLTPGTGLPPVARREQDAEHRTYGVPPLRRDREQIPPPPSLHDAIKAHRARKSGNLEIVRDDTVNASGVQNPPRLVAGR